MRCSALPFFVFNTCSVRLRWQNSREFHRDMETFIGNLADIQVYEVMAIGIQGKEGFYRIKMSYIFDLTQNF